MTLTQEAPTTELGMQQIDDANSTRQEARLRWTSSDPRRLKLGVGA